MNRKKKVNISNKKNNDFNNKTNSQKKIIGY